MKHGKIILFFILLLSGSLLRAHGDLHDRIMALTIQILNQPDRIDLYQNRGQLYLLHEDHKEAIQDFNYCIRNGLRSTSMEVNMAKAHLALEHFTTADSIIAGVLKQEPLHIEGMLVKAEINHHLGDDEQSAIFYERVIRYSDKTVPENYLDAAQAWQRSNSIQGPVRASEVLKLGIHDLGPLVIFYQELVQIYLNEQEIDQAIACQNEIVILSKRKEWALKDRGDLYVTFGKKDEAMDDYKNSLTLINGRPARIRNVPATRDLHRAVLNQIEQLKSP